MIIYSYIYIYIFFFKICEEVMACRLLKSPHIQHACLSILPRLAAANPESFAKYFLEDVMMHVMNVLKKACIVFIYFSSAFITMACWKNIADDFCAGYSFLSSRVVSTVCRVADIVVAPTQIWSLNF